MKFVKIIYEQCQFRSIKVVVCAIPSQAVPIVINPTFI